MKEKDRDELLQQLRIKETQLQQAEREYLAWSRSKYKSSEKIAASELLTTALREEIATLNDKLKNQA